MCECISYIYISVYMYAYIDHIQNYIIIYVCIGRDMYTYIYLYMYT